MKSCLYLLLAFITFFSCNVTDSEPLGGNWFVLEMIYKGQKMYPINKTNKLSIKPLGFEEYEIIEFIDSTNIVFPGFNSDELPLIYNIRNDSLYISLNEQVFNDYKLHYLNDAYDDIALIEFDSEFDSYKYLIDSLNNMKKILLKKIGANSQQYAKALNIYLGKYKIIQHSSNYLVLQSATTKFVLSNQQAASNRQIDKLFEGL